MEANRQGAGGTLVLAAQALAKNARTEDEASVLREHAFVHSKEGLRQYLAIRLGDAQAAQGILTRLQAELAESASEFEAPPGFKARLYRRARELTENTPQKSRGTLLWYSPNAAESHGEAVRALREGTDEQELLELRFARELSTEEIAYVLAVPESDVVERLKGAESQAQKIHRTKVGRSPAKPLETALLHAFALQRDEAARADTLDSGQMALSEVGSAQTAVSGPTSRRRDMNLPAGRLPLGEIIGERYRLEKHIGEGAFADVYRAEDIEVPGHVLALKVLRRASHSEEKRQTALRELRIIAAVYHPSIVQFKDYGWYEERLWFAMPWYDGEVLEDRLEAGGITRAEARRIFEPLARALATLHVSDIRHQDIKPDNIFLAELRGFEGEQVLPVLLDLGVAAKDAELVLAGTPTYFAPEVAAQFAHRVGDPYPTRPIGGSADVFSLALTLRNALEPETQPDVAAGAVDAFIRDRASDPSAPFTRRDLKFLNKHLSRWLDPDPNARPTADEFAEELAVLTRPEETRARRLGYLKLFGPIVIAASVLIGFFTLQILEHQQTIEDKAALAEEEAAAARANLEDEASRRAELQDQVMAAERAIAERNLSSAELASQLAQAQGNLAVARRRLGNATGRATLAQVEAEEAQESLREARANLRETQRRVSQLEGQTQTLQGQVEAQERNLSQRNAELSRQRTAVARAEADLQTARDAAARANQRVSMDRANLERAQQAQAAAEARSNTLQNRLTHAEARISTLERQLAAARRNAGTGGGVPTGGSTGGTGGIRITPSPGSMEVPPGRRQ